MRTFTMLFLVTFGVCTTSNAFEVIAGGFPRGALEPGKPYTLTVRLKNNSKSAERIRTSSVLGCTTFESSNEHIRIAGEKVCMANGCEERVLPPQGELSVASVLLVDKATAPGSIEIKVGYRECVTLAQVMQSHGRTNIGKPEPESKSVWSAPVRLEIGR